MFLVTRRLPQLLVGWNPNATFLKVRDDAIEHGKFSDYLVREPWNVNHRNKLVRLS